MNKKSKNALLLVVILAIVGIAVGYAALSQELVLTGTATVKGSSDWNVHFADETTTTPSEVGASNATISLDSNKLEGTFSATLEPGGSVAYEVSIVNGGTIAAEAQAPVVEVVGEANYAKCTVEEIGDTTSDLIDDTVHTYKVTLSCDAVDSTDDLPTSEVKETFKVKFNYVQKTSGTN